MGLFRVNNHSGYAPVGTKIRSGFRLAGVFILIIVAFVVGVFI